MPIIPEVQERLRSLIPAETDRAVIRAVLEGIVLADSLFDKGMLLHEAMGHDLLGHVRRVGIAQKIKEHCQRGDIPLTAEIKLMPRGRWHWLEIHSVGLRAHMCRTDDVYCFPAEAESRQDPRLSIQGNLLSWAERHKSVRQIIREIPELYAWLTFRVVADGNLSHLCWCSPAPDVNEYIAMINLLEEAKRSSEPTPDPARPSPKDLLEFQEEFRKQFEQSKDRTKDGSE